MKGAPTMERLLFVDDDLEILEINRKYFETCGYHADTATDALTALSCLSEHMYQCVILDIHMEKTDGFCLCRTIRANYSIPVIFLTNLTDEEIMIESFDCGGDDYITKPYLLKELEMRIRARIRNSRCTVPSCRTPGLSVDNDEKQAYIGNLPLNLTVNEFEILRFLMDHKGIPYRQEEIYRAVWGESCYNTHSIQILIMRIRKKIQVLSPEKEYIKTQWGKGYLFTE